MKISFMRLDRQFDEHQEKFIQLTRQVLAHGKVLQGPEVQTLENHLSRYFNLPYAAATASGTDSLVLALKALGLKPGEKVAVSSLSFVASASSVLLAGGIPVFVDIDEYYQSNQKELLNLIKKREVAGVIGVHLYGQMMDLASVYSEAQARGIFVIEDAAQCLGSLQNSHPPGQMSDVTAISFDPTKVVGAFGSGGAILTTNPKIYEKLVRLRYHGHVGGRVFVEAGLNSQLSSLQAAYIDYKLTQMSIWQEKRCKIASIYFTELESLRKICLPKVAPGNVHNFHKFVIRVEGLRDALQVNLKNQGIETSIHYHLPLYRQPLFENKLDRPYFLPQVEMTCTEILSLPIYPELTLEEAHTVTRAIRQFLKDN